jgi:hypothetical protein
MNEMWNRRVFWLGATVLGLVLFGCGDAGGLGGSAAEVLDGEAQDRLCVCPGPFGRLDSPCPMPPSTARSWSA